MFDTIIRRIITTCLALGLTLAQTTQLSATTAGNCAEMGFALAMVPFEIAARRCAQDATDERTAAALSFTANTLSLANKAFFFKNNLDAYVGIPWDINRRDCYLNGALTLRTLTKWYGDLKVCLYGKQEPVAIEPDVDVLLDDEVVEPAQPVAEPVITPPTLDDQTLSQLAHTWQVYALPCLKGLTALAVACTQPRATPFSSRQGRLVAMAAHSLVCLLDEQATMAADAPNKKLLYALLMVNTALLGYEVYAYAHLEKEAKRPAQTEPAVAPWPVSTENPATCWLCAMSGDQTALHDQNSVRLGCGHVYCRDCCLGLINANQRGGGIAGIRCPARDESRDPNDRQCPHILDVNDFRTITQDAAILGAYDEAITRKNNPAYKHCPTPGCAAWYICPDPSRDGTRPAEHVCAQCNHRYCSDCLHEHVFGTDCPNPERDDRATAAWIAQHTRPCPQCNRRIEKNNGCNHMTCSRDVGGCGHEFCWLCGQPCRGGSHFDAGGPCNGRWFDHSEDNGGALNVPVPAMATQAPATVSPVAATSNPASGTFNADTIPTTAAVPQAGEIPNPVPADPYPSPDYNRVPFTYTIPPRSPERFVPRGQRPRGQWRSRQEPLFNIDFDLGIPDEVDSVFQDGTNANPASVTPDQTFPFRNHVDSDADDLFGF